MIIYVNHLSLLAFSKCSINGDDIVQAADSESNMKTREGQVRINTEFPSSFVTPPIFLPFFSVQPPPSHPPSSLFEGTIWSAVRDVPNSRYTFEYLIEKLNGNLLKKFFHIPKLGGSSIEPLIWVTLPCWTWFDLTWTPTL